MEVCNMKIIFEGVVNHPTGVATHHRNLLKALRKKGVDVQIFDFYRKEYGTEDLYTPVPISEGVGVLTYTPAIWNRIPPTPRRVAYCIHEGSKCPKEWALAINQTVEKLLVPSKATKNLFMSSGVRVPISVVHEGIDPELYKPTGKKIEITPPSDVKIESPFVFLFVGSWTGTEGSHKGVDVLIKAYSEEFKKDENVLLFLKLSTFWTNPIDYNAVIKGMKLPEDRGFILADNSEVPEEALPNLYRTADCFVSATRGESWCLPLGEAMACGLPVICMNNDMAGYMDYVPKENFFFKSKGVEQADPSFYCGGNMMPVPDKEDLKRVMREVFNSSKKKREEVGKANAKVMKEKFTWEKSAEKFIEVVK